MISAKKAVSKITEKSSQKNTESCKSVAIYWTPSR